MITLGDVRDKLLTLDEARKLLAPLEAMGETDFEMGGGQIVFRLPDGWNDGLADREGAEATDAVADIDGHEFPLTKDAVLAASSLIGITREYMSKTPGGLMEPHMNYWYENGDKKLKLIYRPDGVGVSFCRSALSTFSMDRVIEQTLDKIYGKYGPNTEVLADQRLEAGIRNTSVRLLVPETERSVPSKYASEEGNDPWSVGIALQSSLTGELPLSVSGFMLRYTCTNGATTEHSASARHRRRRGEEVEEVYQWVGQEVDAILGSLEEEMRAVEELTRMPLEGEIGPTLQEMYRTFRVPVASRAAITEQLVESDDLSAYGVMQAVTQAGNDSSLSAAEVSRIWSVGGSIPHVLGGRCPNCHRLPV